MTVLSSESTTAFALSSASSSPSSSDSLYISDTPHAYKKDIIGARKPITENIQTMHKALFDIMDTIKRLPNPNIHYSQVKAQCLYLQREFIFLASQQEEMTKEELVVAKHFQLLTQKPVIFACNVKDDELADADNNPFVQQVRDYTAKTLNCEAIVISAQIESDLVDLSEEDAQAFLTDLGVAESGTGLLIRATYHLLGLRTYFTAGEQEVRAWTIRAGDTAPKAAGVIHGDFERGFIKAETVSYENLIECGSVAVAREKGVYRIEGKEYVVADGDVLHFRFNV